MKYEVIRLTNEGYFVWEIASILNITEAEVVRLQGR